MSDTQNIAKPKLGFVGLGKMGQAMATNLVKAGYAVRVYNRTSSATAPLVELGATAVRDPVELADCDIVFSMLANDAAVDALILQSGLLEALGKTLRSTEQAEFPRPMHVSCTTLSVPYVQAQVQQHSRHGVEYIALPVIGRPDAAAEAKLHLLFAGNPEALKVLHPVVVPAVGQSLRNYGADPAKASVMKIAFNMTLACAIEAMSEGSALVQRYGLQSSDYTSLLAQTLFDCKAYHGYGDIIASRQFEPAGASLAGVGLKDCKLALQAGEHATVPLPFASVLRDSYLDAMANGMGEWDWAAIAVVAERRAGINAEQQK